MIFLENRETIKPQRTHVIVLRTKRKSFYFRATLYRQRKFELSVSFFIHLFVLELCLIYSHNTCVVIVLIELSYRIVCYYNVSIFWNLHPHSHSHFHTLIHPYTQPSKIVTWANLGDMFIESYGKQLLSRIQCAPRYLYRWKKCGIHFPWFFTFNLCFCFGSSFLFDIQVHIFLLRSFPNLLNSLPN